MKTMRAYHCGVAAEAFAAGLFAQAGYDYLVGRYILMGRASREKPAHLADKILQIRTALDLSQNGMLRRLEIAEKGYRNYISDFENGVREPSLPVLLKYARLSGVSMDVLVDDELDLPQQLPPLQTSDLVMKEGKTRYGKAR